MSTSLLHLDKRFFLPCYKHFLSCDKVLYRRFASLDLYIHIYHTIYPHCTDVI